MKIKLEQFIKLQQRNMTIQKNLAQFNHLCQYASEYVRTDEQKKDWYVRALHTRFGRMLTTIPNATFHEVVSATIAFEEVDRLDNESEKRKTTPIVP
jgi:hypothetical protein